MTSPLLTVPESFTTNTDEKGSLEVNISNELAAGESVVSAVCELWRKAVDKTATGLVGSAICASPLITQSWDARSLSTGEYRLIWTATLNTGDIRSWRTRFLVENHDAG